MSQERRENHDECEDKRERKYIRKVSGGEVWYCHNCGGKGFIPNRLSTPSNTIRNVMWSRANNINSICEQVVRNIQLPRDVISEIPALGLGWLYKYYITDEEIKQFGICYSEYYNRLILPVYNDTKLVYWQGRSLKPPYTKENPKYLNIRQSGAKNVFFKRYNGYSQENISGLIKDTLVVVEDILSAIRVGRFYSSLALLGSYFPLSLVSEFKKYEKILIYLDQDKWETAIKAGIKFSSLTGKRFIIKYNEHDPKVLTDTQLEEFLNV